MFLTPTEYYYGFTADSDPKMSIDFAMSSEIEGIMPAKTHQAKRSQEMTKEDMKQRIAIKVEFKPQFQVGEFDAYLCFMFPNEKSFSKFYKITGKSTSA